LPNSKIGSQITNEKEEDILTTEITGKEEETASIHRFPRLSLIEEKSL
jgi:hypothetical protein